MRLELPEDPPGFTSYIDPATAPGRAGAGDRRGGAGRALPAGQGDARALGRVRRRGARATARGRPRAPREGAPRPGGRRCRDPFRRRREPDDRQSDHASRARTRRSRTRSAMTAPAIRSCRRSLALAAPASPCPLAPRRPPQRSRRRSSSASSPSSPAPPPAPSASRRATPPRCSSRRSTRGKVPAPYATKGFGGRPDRARLHRRGRRHHQAGERVPRPRAAPERGRGHRLHLERRLPGGRAGRRGAEEAHRLLRLRHAAHLRGRLLQVRLPHLQPRRHGQRRGRALRDRDAARRRRRSPASTRTTPGARTPGTTSRRR